jgi:transcriptional regulator with XRE-family HTH domain
MGDRIRARREERGLTQQALAERAGLTRQLVGAMESQRHIPSVSAALAVARVLGVSVEHLFGEGSSPVVPVLDRPPAEDAPVRVGRVGDVVVADEGWGPGSEAERWVLADGVLSGTRVDLFPGAQPASLVVAGCDPMLGSLAELVEHLAGHRVLAVHTSTQRAIDALRQGRAHAVVVHAPCGSLRPPDGLEVQRWRLARWRAGLAGPGRSAPSLDELASRRATVVQREPGAGTQAALARALSGAGVAERLPGPVGAGHLDVARRVRSREAKAGVTMEAAALVMGLPFAALEEHEVELWVHQRWNSAPAAAALVEVLISDAFARRAATVPGYDLAGMGTELGRAG